MYYVVALFSTRALALVTLLCLSHFLQEKEFGTYYFVVSNALFVQLVFGSWLSSASTLIFSRIDFEELRDEAATVVRIYIFIVLIIFFVVSILSIFKFTFSYKIYFVLLFGISIIASDTYLSILNSLEKSKEYSIYSIIRNLTIFIASLSLAIIDRSGTEITFALSILSFLILIIFIAKNLDVNFFHISRSSVQDLIRYFKIGFPGALVLGIYTLVQVPARNLIGQRLGPELLSNFALASDFFYGPLAISGSVATLLANRSLFRERLEGHRNSKFSKRYLQNIIAFLIPYSMASIFIGEFISNFVFPASVSTHVAKISWMFCTMNSAIVAIYSICYIAFSRNEVKALYSLISITFFVPLFAIIIIPLDSIFDYAITINISLAIAMIIGFLLGYYLNFISLDFKHVSKVFLLSILIVSVIEVPAKVIDSAFAYFVSVPASAALYLYLASKFRVIDMITVFSSIQQKSKSNA